VILSSGKFDSIQKTKFSSFNFQLSSTLLA
jgi:hypothetical protein